MTHLHKRSGNYFEVGSYISLDHNKTYDITIISYWKDAEQEKVGPPVELIGYYFGDYDEETTDYYIDRWFENRELEIKTLQAAQHYLDAYLITNEGVLDADETSRLEESIDATQKLLHDRSWQIEIKPVSDKKMTRSEYLRYIEDLYSSGKIDDDAMDALYALSHHYPNE